MMRTQEALNSAKKNEQIASDRALETLLEDANLQLALNTYRTKNNLPQIDFVSVKTLDDVKDSKYNITHDDLINCMRMAEEEQMAEQANASFDNSANRQHLKTSGDAEHHPAMEGLNVLTYEENHNFLRDL